MVRRSDERGMLQYLAEGGGVAGEAADHGRRRRHVPAGDHQAPGHSWEELISSLAFHKTLEPHHARSFLPEHRSTPLQNQVRDRPAGRPGDTSYLRSDLRIHA